VSERDAHRDDRRGGYDRYDRRDVPARDENGSKRQRVDQVASGERAAARVEPPPREETAAEKLARLKAKAAARQGGIGLSGGRIGGDYTGSGNTSQPAKGIARYQQLMRDNRR
jgi:hypothetical protein